MTKMVGAAVFKATCLRLIDEMQKDGEPINITKRGKVVAVMEPVRPEKMPGSSLLGSMKGSVTWAPGVDPTASIVPDWEAEWDAGNPPELYRR